MLARVGTFLCRNQAELMSTVKYHPVLIRNEHKIGGDVPFRRLSLTIEKLLSNMINPPQTQSPQHSVMNLSRDWARSTGTPSHLPLAMAMSTSQNDHSAAAIRAQTIRLASSHAGRLRNSYSTCLLSTVVTSQEPLWNFRR